MADERSFEESSNCESSPRQQKKPSNWYYYRLESECSNQDNSDTESIFSIQDNVTDCAKDTTDTTSTIGNGRNLEGIEYEIASPQTGNEQDSCYMLYKSSSEENLETHLTVIVSAKETVNSDSLITDVEDSDSPSRDSSVSELITFRTCLQCKSKHKNALFRFCRQCYQDRKAFFPPRPKRFRKTRPKRKSSSLAKLTARRASSGPRYSGVASHDSGTLSLAHSSGGSTTPLADLSSQTFGISTQESAVGLSGTSHSGSSQRSALVLEESEPGRKESSLADSLDSVIASQAGAPAEHSKSAPPIDDGQRPSTSRGLDADNKRKRALSESSISEGGEMPPSKKTARARSEDLVKMLRKDAEVERSLSDGGERTAMSESRQKCIFCNIRPTNAIFLHGSIAHMCSCYRCAMITWRMTKKCPICNRVISNVVKVFST